MQSTVARSDGQRVRTAGRLLRTLARSDDPRELVRAVLERSAELDRVAKTLPDQGRVVVERLVRTAAASSRRRSRQTSRPPARGTLLDSPRPEATPVGSSRVVKLANKLMTLIHLAESERRMAEAQRQVRLSEEGTEAHGVALAGQGDEEDQSKNIQALRQDVLEAVLRELENIQWRREDPDGPSIWC